MSTKRSAPTAGPSKRARFASPTGTASAADMSQAHLEDDLTTSAASKAKAKRSLKGQEGYESDSSDDEEGVVPSRNRKTAHGEADGDAMDEDDDMFGGGVAEVEAESSTKDAIKTSDKQGFLDLNDIEGQEFGGTSRLRDAEDSDIDSEEEAERLERAKGLDGPMGYEMTSFNMKAELTEGRMTADGENFIANDRDPGEDHDKWLEGLDRAEIRKARKGARERERLEKEREERERMEEDDEQREERLMSEMVGLLERGETVLEALQRLGKQVEAERKKLDSDKTGNKKKSWAEKQRERKAMLQGPTDGSMQVDSSHALPSHPFNRLSELITSLQSLGQLDVYSMTRESLQRLIPAEPPTSTNVPVDTTGPSREPAANGSTQPSGAQLKAFDYRFSKPYISSLPPDQRPIEREIFGPFPFPTLMTWRQSGVLGGPDCMNIELRLAGPQPGPWGSWKDVVESEVLAGSS